VRERIAQTDAPAERPSRPAPREHAIAAALFVGFGLFFVVLFFVLLGWWFRWVVGGLGVVSVLHGLWHAVESRPGEGSGFGVEDSGQKDQRPPPGDEG